MDLKMHVYSVPLRSPFAFPCVPWNFEVGNASDQKLEVGEPASYYTNHCQWDNSLRISVSWSKL